MELRVLNAKVVGVEEEHHRAPVRLAQQARDNAHEDRDGLEEDAHGALDGLTVLVDRRVQIRHVQGAAAPPPDQHAGHVANGGGHESKDHEEHDACDEGLGKDPAILNRTEPLPVRIEAHQHGADEQEGGDDDDDPGHNPGRTFHRGGGSVQSGSQLQLQSSVVRI